MPNRIIAGLLLIFIGVTSALFFPVALAIRLLTAPFDRRWVLLHLFSCLWASLYLWIMPAWSVRVEGERRRTWQRHFVIVSNHQSQLDILLAYRLFIPFKWVSKADVFRLPLIGWNMWLNGYIKLKRGDRAGIARMFADCEKALSRGSSVFIFPEGTRSDTGAVRPFKPGAFILAQKMGVPILPVVISGSNAAPPKHSLNFHGRQAMRIRVLPPIAVATVAATPVEALAETVRGVVAAELQRMRA